MVVAPTIPERCYGGGGVAGEDYADGTSATMRAGKGVDGCCSASDDEGAVVRLLASRGRDGHNALFLIMDRPPPPLFSAFAT